MRRAPSVDALILVPKISAFSGARSELPVGSVKIGIWGATEHLWKAFHNCSVAPQTPNTTKSPSLMTMDEFLEYLETRGSRNATSPGGVSKEVGGTRAPLTLLLFGCGILRRLLPRVSLAKPTSAALRF